MSDKRKKTQQLIKSAEIAIAKIADPALRAKAIAKLEATRKRIAQSRSADTNRSRSTERARDKDFER